MVDGKRKNTADTDASFRAAEGSNNQSSAQARNENSGDAEPDFATKVATVGIIGVGVALIEVSLIPGMVIGLAAAFAPKYAPRLVEGVKPLVRTTVRGAVKLAQKTREAIAEAGEQVQDMVAEAKLEDVQGAVGSASTADASTAKV